MFKVGITGGIGSGKTTVTDIFRELGIEVVDADLVARELVEPGSPALAEIARHFGAKILHPNGELDRARLRDQVFSNPPDKLWLERLLHPQILRLCRERLKTAHSAYVMLSSPLLIESGEHRLVDRVLVVDLPVDLQISRTANRDRVPEAQIQQIIESQLGRAERLKRADDILDNSLDQLQLRLAVEQLHRFYLRQAVAAGS
jgi:dephospho-CoA kinase